LKEAVKKEAGRERARRIESSTLEREERRINAHTVSLSSVC